MRSARDDNSGPVEGVGRRQGAHWRFTTPAVLLLLIDGPAHGYDLLARLGDVFPRAGFLPDPGNFYRVMRGLESDGAVTSSWDTPKAGPARRVYTLTATGHEQLDGWALTIELDMKAMRGFLSNYRAASRRGRSSATRKRVR